MRGWPVSGVAAITHVQKEMQPKHKIKNWGRVLRVQEVISGLSEVQKNKMVGADSLRWKTQISLYNIQV